MKCWCGLPNQKKKDARRLMPRQVWGEDAFLLAAQGYEVTLYEQNPVVAVLLKDALRRAKQTSDIEGNRSPDETGRGRQRRMYVQTSGSGRCYLPRSHVPGTTEIQPHQQEATADPET